jgi:hypothetical protein
VNCELCRNLLLAGSTRVRSTARINSVVLTVSSIFYLPPLSAAYQSTNPTSTLQRPLRPLRASKAADGHVFDPLPQGGGSIGGIGDIGDGTAAGGDQRREKLGLGGLGFVRLQEATGAVIGPGAYGEIEVTVGVVEELQLVAARDVHGAVATVVALDFELTPFGVNAVGVVGWDGRKGEESVSEKEFRKVRRFEIQPIPEEEHLMTYIHRGHSHRTRGYR